MKINSIKKVSLIGLVLMITSATIAAILPDRSKNLRVEGADNGTLDVNNTNDVLTCIPDDDTVFSCNISVSTTTVFFTYNSFTGEWNTKQTINNTSISDQGYVSSVLS